MAEYRAFIIDERGHVSERVDFKATDDPAAIKHARQYLNGHDVEVWQLARQIARLHHTGLAER